MLSNLPPELVLRILSFLDIHELHLCQLVSVAWNEFMQLNESIIYRAAAIQHNLVPSFFYSLDDAKAANAGYWMKSASSWKDLCQRFFMLDRNWHARGEPSIPRDRLYRSSRGVHRFKLDEENRLVIVTFAKGGLRVLCMDSDELLFELPNSYVRKSAHCEYDNGYLIFDRYGAMEVWKFAFAPALQTHLPDTALPDEKQLNAYEEATRLFSPEGRGVLQPHALLHPPYNCRAYRFVFPTLLIGSLEGQRAFLYDVRSGLLEETIPFPKRDSASGDDEPAPPHLHILYVELSPRHIFICSENEIVILARNHVNIAANRKVLMFPSSDPASAYRIPVLARSRAYRIALSDCQATRGIGERSLDSLVQPGSTEIISLGGDRRHYFCAVHVSPSGDCFAAASWSGLLFLVRNFERALPGAGSTEAEKSLSDEDVTFAIDLQTPVTNLTFGSDGKLICHSYTSFYVVSWPSSVSSAPRTYPSSQRGSPYSFLPPAFSDVRVFHLSDFSVRDALPFVRCVKVTRTAIWFDWSACALSAQWAYVRRKAGGLFGNDATPHKTADEEAVLLSGERQEDHESLASLDEMDDEDDNDDNDEEGDWNFGRIPLCTYNALADACLSDIK